MVRLQLVFNTTKRLYVLDRNGNNVKPFPLKFKDDITQPVSIFDYDKRKNYRLLIYSKGKSVMDVRQTREKLSQALRTRLLKILFLLSQNISELEERISSHLHMGNKMEILNRVGKTRINVKENISFSNNDIYLYNNRFTTSNTNGELIEINQSGKVNHKNLNANSEHKNCYNQSEHWVCAK